MKKIRFDNLEEYIYIDKLNNGLEVYMIPNNKVKNYYMTYSTKFGSLYTEFKGENESKYKSIPNGVAHFLEHLTFKMEDMEASNFFSNRGASTNAYTSYDITCYEVWGTDNFNENLKYLIKFVNTPFYTKENVEAEKGIIIEEIKMRKDDPSNRLIEELNNSIFINDNRKNLISGTIDDVKNTTLDDILNAYNYFYNPENMFIVISGNFNPNEAMGIIEEEISKYNMEPIKVNVKMKKEVNKVNREDFEFQENVSSEKVCIGLKIPLSNFKDINLDRADLNIATSVILNSNFGYSSLLREELLSSHLVNRPVYAYRYIAGDYYIINIIAETDYPVRVTNILKDKLNNLELSEEDFNRKKKVMISNYILGFDDVDYINTNVVDSIIERGEVITNLLERYKNLKYSNALMVLKKFKSKNMSVVTMQKKNTD